ncbi:hypothetical protein [Lysobacter enzymogenes]|nr:hypothetical protein [Lysobacter enzymogenes]QQQ02902.1 hypothetical protein JHW41_08060 [Lysobacter enzymogenes]
MLRKMVRKALTGALRWAYNDKALQCQADGHKHGRADELVNLCPAS